MCFCRGGSPSRGSVPCDLSRHAFDVTCMLSPHQLRLTNSAAAYIVVVQGMMGYPPPPVNRITDTCKNITFPQLRLRAVKTLACRNFIAGGNDIASIKVSDSYADPAFHLGGRKGTTHTHTPKYLDQFLTVLLVTFTTGLVFV